MSIPSIQDIYTARTATLKKSEAADKPEARGLVFQDILATSTAGNRMKSESGLQAAKAADILQLEMMRSAMCLDSTPPPPSAAWGDGRLKSLLSAYGIDANTTGLSSSKAASPVTSGDSGTRLQEDAAPREAPATGGAGQAPITALISKASRRYGVDEGLIRAVIQAESNFKPTAVSPAGARGLMQLMPATAAGLGVTDPFNPEQNIMAGTRFLKDLLNRYGGDMDKALAAYNWGPGNLERGKGRLPRETQDYLVKVKKLYAEYGMG